MRLIIGTLNNNRFGETCYLTEVVYYNITRRSVSHLFVVGDGTYDQPICNIYCWKCKKTGIAMVVIVGRTEQFWRSYGWSGSKIV